MNCKRTASVGQKRRTCIFSSFHTSSFFVHEGKNILCKKDAHFRFCICSLLSAFTAAFAVLLMLSAVFLYKYSAFPTLSDRSARTLTAVFAVIICFFTSFFRYALRCGRSHLAVQLEKNEVPNTDAVLYRLSSLESFKKCFMEYLLYLLSNALICPFLVLSFAVYKTSTKNDAETVIICSILILTYLYFLCIINGVYIFLPHLQNDESIIKRLKYAVILTRGNVCRFIFLNIRLIPYAVTSVLSLGVLHIFYNSALISSSYASFVSFVFDVEKYKNELLKGNDINEQ